MTNGRGTRPDASVAGLFAGAMAGRYDRRQLVRRAMAGGIAAPLATAMLKAAPAAAQEASPAAAPSGEPIKIGGPYNLTGGLASLDNPAADGSCWPSRKSTQPAACSGVRWS